MGCTHAMEYYLAMKRNAIPTCATAGMTPENTLSEKARAKSHRGSDPIYMKCQEVVNLLRPDAEQR